MTKPGRSQSSNADQTYQSVSEFSRSTMAGSEVPTSGPLRPPDIAGLKSARLMLNYNLNAPGLVVSKFDSIEEAIQAMKAGYPLYYEGPNGSESHPELVKISTWDRLLSKMQEGNVCTSNIELMGRGGTKRKKRRSTRRR